MQFLDSTRGALSRSKNTNAFISDGVPRVFVALAAVLVQCDGVLGPNVALVWYSGRLVNDATLGTGAELRAREALSLSGPIAGRLCFCR